MSSESYESGIRQSRTEFVPETEAGTTPTNPVWELYSDRVREFQPDIDAAVSAARGRGDPDPQDGYAGTEESSLNIVYDLQQKTASGNTFHDGSGDPNDAATYFIERDSDNRAKGPHTILDRIEQSDLDAGNTINGSTARDTRQYVVVKGARGEPTITMDPSDGLPCQVEIDYSNVEKARRYQIDQPTSSEAPIEVWANSTSANDTAQSVTIESEDGSTSESLSLSGTSDVGPTTATFSDIDAIELDTECEGDVRVYVDDGSGTATGDQIAVIRGQNYYDHGEGDLGVPLTGTSSHASAIGQAYELPHTVSVERPDGTDVGANWEATEFAVANNYSADPRGGTPRPAISAGDREATVDTTVFGETEAVNKTTEHLGTVTDNVRVVFSGGHLQADTAFSPTVGEDGYNASESKSMIDVTYQGTGVTVSA